jgi:hypothetical protein
MFVKKIMLICNQPCTVPQRTLENKNNGLNYECARPDRLKVCYIVISRRPCYGISYYESNAKDLMTLSLSSLENSAFKFNLL